MRVVHWTLLLLVCVSLSSLSGWSQSTSIVIPAGTPEDKDLSTIAAESDGQKRIAAYQDFLKKYADNKPATAYAEWQLSQQYLAAGDTAQALEYGNKAVEAYPNNLDIIMSQASVAQAMKDNSKVVDYAVQGAGVFHSIAKQPKPADVPDSEWTTRISNEQSSAQNAYDFLETSGYNAITSEQDPNKRMGEIEKFTPAFPKSKFDDQITQLALYSLRQLNQPQRVIAYGEKTLATNPDSIPTLLMMADAYAGDPKEAAKAATYANKVITLVGPNPPSDDKTKRSYAGLAHTTLGRAELNQEKLVPAVADFKTAVVLLQDDPQDQQPALFYLGYAYAKQNHKADAVASLQKAAAISGPYQGPAKDMLAKVSAAGPPPKK
jgi:tetratricopeptide (TPR) repeat protein